MKTNTLQQIRLVILGGICCFTSQLAFAQNNNPTGVAGVFNGNSTTGCSYDPFTANATRKIPDITIDAAVGNYVLQWARTMNSRAPGGSGLLFGAGGGWSHSYAWSTDDSETFATATPGTPTYYVVRFPDGRVIRFNPAGTADTCYRGPLGVHERFQPLNQTSLLAYLILSDGGKVEFKADKWKIFDPDFSTWTSGYTYQAQAIINPSGQRTAFTYNANGTLSKVTEPAGRWLQITYASGRISQVQAGYTIGSTTTITQIVNYVYTTFGAYTVLARADYNDGTSAYYSYQASNVTGGAGYPLIRTCLDVRYPGPMKQIAYDFVPGGFYGQFLAEKLWLGYATITVSYNLTTHTETRGGGATRTFTYGTYGNPSPPLPVDFTFPAAAPYLLTSVTDFKGNKTYFGYDAKGYLNKVRDANGNITSFTRAAKTGNLLSVTPPVIDGAAPPIVYTYTDQTTGYYLTSIKDQLNHTTTFGYDASMNNNRIDYPDGGYETFSHDTLSHVQTHRNRSGGTESFAYDARGLLTSYTPPVTPSDPNPGAHPTRYDYNANDHLNHITDPRGNVTTLQHNWIGQLTILQHPDGSMRGWTYNDDGTVESFNDENNRLTTYTYDSFKRTKTIFRPLRYAGDTSARTTTFWYDANATANDYSHTDANPTFVITPAGVRTANVYDNNFRILSTTIGDTSRTDSSPATTSYTYDAVGNVLTKKDPNGQATGAEWVYTYDARNRLTTVDDPTVNYPTGANKNSLGHTINYTYDAGSNQTSVQYANDQTTTYDAYDAMNRLTQMVVHQAPTPGAVTRYTWTKSGKLDTMTDPGLNVYDYDYDPLNRLITTTYPADSGGIARTETRTYDFAGNLSVFKNRAGNKQTFTYDSRNRETRYDWDDGMTPYRILTYDDASHILTCLQNALLTRTYYDDGLLKSEHIHNYNYGDYDGTISYTYDADGRRATTQYPSGRLYSSGYTGRGELRTLYDITAGPASIYEAYYIYDPAGNLTSRRMNGNQTHTSSFYDTLNRLTLAQLVLVGSTPKFNYGYDEMSNRRYEQRDGSLADGFSYNLNNALISFRRDGTFDGSTVSGGALSTLVYDASGNRTSVVESGASTTYTAVNNLNQYPTVGGVAATYDANGNLKTYNGWTYTYDAMNRLTAVSKTGASANFWYDGFNRVCTWQVNGSSNARFNVWDGWNLVAEYKAGNVLDTEYLHGAATDELVSMTRSGQTYYFFQDGRGSTSHVVNSSGQLIESYKYDAYGEPTIYNSAGAQISASSIGNRFLFTGREYYKEIGLYDYRTRFYSADWGRFLQPDPIGFAGGDNLYRYCGNNGVNLADPLGLFAWGQFGQGAALMVGGGVGMFMAAGGGGWKFRIGYHSCSWPRPRISGGSLKRLRNGR